MKIKTITLCLFVLITSVIRAQNLQSGLQAHYEFDGTLTDETSNSYDLTSTGNPQYISFFAIDSALTLNGLGGFGQNGSFNNSAFTQTAIALWFKSDTINTISQSDQYIIMGAFAGFGINLENSNGEISTYFSYSSSNAMISDSSYADNNWHHVVAQNNGNSTSLYIDGQLVKSQTETHNNGNGISSISQRKIFIGSSNLNTRTFAGQINDVRIYDRILNQIEITALSTFPTSTAIQDSESDDLQIKVYPNPTKGNVIISADETLIGSNFIVRNLLGQNITEGFLQSERQDVTINGEKGIYFIEIFTPNNKKIVSKVIKK